STAPRSRSPSGTCPLDIPGGRSSNRAWRTSCAPFHDLFWRTFPYSAVETPDIERTGPQHHTGDIDDSTEHFDIRALCATGHSRVQPHVARRGAEPAGRPCGCGAVREEALLAAADRASGGLTC